MCFNSFSYCKGDQKKTIVISQMFNHVQLHVHWMHLLNIRIYLHIYNTFSTNTTLLPAGAWRWNDVVLTFMWRPHVSLTSFWRHMSAGCDQDRFLKVVWPWKWNLPCSVRCIANKIWTQINIFFTCSAWLYVKELEKIIAMTFCFMHQSFIRPNYMFNNDAYFFRFSHTKIPFDIF